MKALLHRMAPAVDEVSLATDVYLPAGPGPFPTILVRTPCHRSGLQGQARPFVERGYAFRRPGLPRQVRLRRTVHIAGERGRRR